MPDALIPIIIVLFFVVPVVVLFGLFPIYLYNIAWRALRETEPALPVFGASPMASSVYFRISGWFATAYGLVCLCHGLSGQLFIVDLAINFCGECTASPSRKIELWIWLATLWPIVLGRFWMPSARAQRIHEPSDAQKVFFWNGVIAQVKDLVRPDRPSRARRTAPRRATR